MIPMTTRSEEEKLRVVLEGVRLRANVKAICRAHGVHTSQFYGWKCKALEEVKAGPASQLGAVTQHKRQEITRLERLIAEYAIALRVFKRELCRVPLQTCTTT